ncbi:hypothetical protein [Saccharomonospora saliphila]|uniref:hypothetical protein n=1 Tax=Saccharomonospora saliphila TaxID=369829 RepID=UPI00036D27C7|nr:hypothetical protein [Saccharomonospora saliphila]
MSPEHPTVEEFMALARSSPTLWLTLRCTVTRRRPHPSPEDGGTVPDWLPDWASAGVRAWVRRPDAQRVEAADGTVLDITSGHQPIHGHDTPLFQDYHWVAMLAPGELGEGTDDLGEPGPAPVTADTVVDVTHGGRRAWQADLRPTEYYDPLCGCCPLLFSAESEDIEAGAGATPLRERYPGLRYADAHRVRLDVATGVCVYTEELGGSRPGAGHDVRIEAVDEPMPDSLFARATRRRG